MGHLVGKDAFRQLGRKIDGLETRIPWNEKPHAVLKEVEKVAGYEKSALRRILDGLTTKGLVMDKAR